MNGHKLKTEHDFYTLSVAAAPQVMTTLELFLLKSQNTKQTDVFLLQSCENFVTVCASKMFG